MLKDCSRCSLNDLFKVEAKQHDMQALTFIQKCRSLPWPPLDFTCSTAKPSERTVMLSISRNMLRKEVEGVMDEVTEVLSEDESLAGSDGATTTIEGKVKAREANVQQAIGTCVVSSFTEKALHPTQQALVPTLLMDATEFRVCFYDCEKDVLLLTESKSLATKGGLATSIAVAHR